MVIFLCCSQGLEKKSVSEPDPFKYLETEPKPEP